MEKLSKFLGPIVSDSIISYSCREIVTFHISINNWNILGDKVKFEGSKSRGFSFTRNQKYKDVESSDLDGNPAWIVWSPRSSGIPQLYLLRKFILMPKRRRHIFPKLLRLSPTRTRTDLISGYAYILGHHLSQAACQDCSH